MENNYIITVKRAEEANPEFIEENEELAKGMKASGYVLIMFNEDEEPIAESIANESTYGIANYLSKDIGTVCNILNQAIPIAEGLRKAREIEFKQEKAGKWKELKNMIDDLKERIENDQEE